MIKLLYSKFLNRDNIKYTSILITIILGIGIVCIFKNINAKNDGLVINKIPMLEKLEKNKIGVYIDGEVNKVGYIKIAKGSTLEYAINKAGGITKKADIQSIDLKKILRNKEKIIIPTIKEKFGDENIENNIDKININMSSKEDLMELEGIGEKTAENIIRYRENNKFDTIEELMEVKGIGEGKFEKIERRICI